MGSNVSGMLAVNNSTKNVKLQDKKINKIIGDILNDILNDIEHNHKLINIKAQAV